MSSAPARVVALCEFEGQTWLPKRGHWNTDTGGDGATAKRGRLIGVGNTLRVMCVSLTTFRASPVGTQTGPTRLFGLHRGQALRCSDRTKVVQRCMLMTTDPGDLVLDPTCGSGTTAYVAEQWGRRWITVDTSRVPLALARQSLLTATFPYYDLRDLPVDPPGVRVQAAGRTARARRSAGLSRTSR